MEEHDDKKRLDPYDPRTGATGNDEPDEADDADAHDDVETEPSIQRAGARASPGSGEDEDAGADLQPDDVENGDTAR
jgi:hypothetical protein